MTQPKATPYWCKECEGTGGREVPDQGWRDKWVTCQACKGTGLAIFTESAQELKTVGCEEKST